MSDPILFPFLFLNLYLFLFPFLSIFKKNNFLFLFLVYSCDSFRFPFPFSLYWTFICRRSHAWTCVLLGFRGLRFVQVFLQSLVDGEKDENNPNLIRVNVTKAYEISLKKYHSWFVQKLFQVRACYMVTIIPLWHTAGTEVFVWFKMPPGLLLFNLNSTPTNSQLDGMWSVMWQ